MTSYSFAITYMVTVRNFEVKSGKLNQNLH